MSKADIRGRMRPLLYLTRPLNQGWFQFWEDLRGKGGREKEGEGAGRGSGSVFKAGKKVRIGEGCGKGHQGSRMAGQGHFNCCMSVY